MSLIHDLFGTSSVGKEDISHEEIEKEKSDIIKEKEKAKAKTREAEDKGTTGGYASDKESDYGETKKSNVYGFKSNVQYGSRQPESERSTPGYTVIYPKSYDECSKFADRLRRGELVAISFENVPSDIAERIYDFVLGATYAFNGNVSKVSSQVYMFAPPNMPEIPYEEEKKFTFSTKSENPWAKLKK